MLEVAEELPEGGEYGVRHEDDFGERPMVGPGGGLSLETFRGTPYDFRRIDFLCGGVAHFSYLCK